MVSQPSSTSDVVLRGASSVVSSRHSSSRRHGHGRGRSHVGGSSYVPQNEFPVFTHTGDVEILVKAGGQTNRYLLHRLILTQCSGFFETSTSQEWSRATIDGAGELTRIREDSGSVSVRTEPRKRWRYELDSGTGNDDIPMLVQKERTEASVFGSADAMPPPVRNKPPTSNPSFFRSVANLTLPSSSHATSAPPPISQEDQELLNDYDNLFRIFYNYSPALDPIDIATAYIQSKSLLTLADLYDALPVVGPRIDHHMLQFNSRLYKQIAKYPSSYLKLGYMAQSKTIFQEALIHVAGGWPMGERHIRHQLPDSVLEIIEDKVEDLEVLVGKVEGRLFRINLLTSRGERVTPANSYLDWLAVSLFRQWVAEQTSPPSPVPAPRTPPSRTGHQSRSSNASHSPLPPPPSSSPNLNLGRVYRTLGTAPSTYLGHEECKRFLKQTPELYSRESMKKLEKRLEELKAMAREIVKPLMRSSLLGDGAGAGYLVCSIVDDPRDFPWLECS